MWKIRKIKKRRTSDETKFRLHAEKAAASVAHMRAVTDREDDDDVVMRSRAIPNVSREMVPSS